MATYYGRFGTRYTTAGQLGSGGEGTVYTLSGYNSIVAKIYKDSRFPDGNSRAVMERKLKAMLAMNVPYTVSGVPRFAWPQDILYENNVMKGFIMPEIHTKYKIYDMYRGGRNAVREKLYPDYTWKYSVQFAYHLAWLVDYLHSYNIVIGDFNQSNIAVDVQSGTVVIIDCDSFDIRDPITGEHFPCTVGLPEMLAPELQAVGNLSQAAFTKSSDYFSLAIHIFRLLMDNADPFGGVITTGASMSSIPANQAICNGECAYVRNVPGKKIPSWSQKPEMLPPEILGLFRRTFDYTALTAKKNISRRATAYDWAMALQPYGMAEPNPLLKRCPVNRKHVYPAHNRRCPWCEQEAETKTQGKPAVKTAADRTENKTTDRSRQKKKKKKNPWPGRFFRAAVVSALLAAAYRYYTVQESGRAEKAKDLFWEGQQGAAISAPASDSSVPNQGNSAVSVPASDSSAPNQENSAVSASASGSPVPNQGNSAGPAPASSESLPLQELLAGKADGSDDELYGTAEEEKTEYILEGSDSRYIAEEELYPLTQQEIQLARNEIYARHGRRFDTDWIREHFEGTDWYTPQYDPDYFDQNLTAEFNEYEKANIDVITAYEERMGYY